MGYSQLSLRTHSQKTRKKKRSKRRTENNIIWFILCHGTSMKGTQTNSRSSSVDHSKSEFCAATGPRQKRCVSSHPSNSHTNPASLDTQNPGHRGAESEFKGISPPLPSPFLLAQSTDHEPRRPQKHSLQHHCTCVLFKRGLTSVAIRREVRDTESSEW